MSMNEAEVRAWIKEIGTVVLKGATITNTTVDDQVIGMFFTALDNDFVWKFLWPLIDGIFTDETLVQASPEFDEACATKAIDPLTIIAIVKAIYEIWKMFKKGQA
jgi:hypothetical protein